METTVAVQDGLQRNFRAGELNVYGLDFAGRGLQSLEALAGTRLLDRSSRGVTLTPAGRRLFEQARRLLEQADAVEEVLERLGRTDGPLVLAASHSATEAFVATVLAAACTVTATSGGAGAGLVRRRAKFSRAEPSRSWCAPKMPVSPGPAPGTMRN